MTYLVTIYTRDGRRAVSAIPFNRHNPIQCRQVAQTAPQHNVIAQACVTASSWGVAAFLLCLWHGPEE